MQSKQSTNSWKKKEENVIKWKKKMNVDHIKAKVNEFVGKYPVINDPLTKLSESSKIDKAFIAIAIALLPVLFSLLFGYGKFVIDLIGFVYPVYGSIKAIESKDAAEDTQWLTYWLLFSVFKMLEQVADVLISNIPFYFVSKVLFLIWCYYPSTKGATVIYNAVIKPYVVPMIVSGDKSE